MINTKTTLTNKLIGILMLAGAFLTVFAMLHHPEGTTQSAAQNSTMKWVHGSLIFLLVFNGYGLDRFTDFHKGKGRDMKLGSLFYFIGLGAFIGATLVSGFIQTSLVPFYGADTESFSNFNHLAAIFNQALAKLGVVTFGAAGIALAPALIAERGTARLVGIVGGIVGTILIVSILSEQYLSVLFMTILTVLIVIWHAAIAYWLLKN